MGLSTRVGLGLSAWNEANKVKHREPSKEIVSLTCLLGTGEYKTIHSVTITG